MSDPLKKVRSGDPLVIPATTFNTFVDSARDYLQRQQTTGQKPTQAARQPGAVLVKNVSGADRGRFDVLGIDSPVFTPTDNLETFKNAVAVNGVTPTAGHAGAFAILLEPIATGAMGRAVVSGVTPVKVNVTDESHRYAEAQAGQPGYLASAESGSALILWKEAGTGEKWALVKLGNPGGASAAEPAVLCAVKEALGDATYTVREQTMTGQTAFADKQGADDLTATNVAEIGIGPGEAVDAGTVVSVSRCGEYYVFSHPCYAKYLD